MRWVMRAAGAMLAVCVVVATAAPAAPARARRRAPLVLATGDSMIQILDGLLAQRLARRARVVSDAHISTGITVPGLLNWQAHARSTARRLRPAVTVVFLGANDGYGIGRTPCCGRRWVGGYAARAGRMMDAWSRRGAGRVYWLLLPAPRPHGFRPVYRAVDAALRRAARSRRRTVRLVDLGRIFTPGGRYRSAMRWHGHVRVVRQTDGVHLNVTGARIAEDAVVAAMRRDREPR